MVSKIIEKIKGMFTPSKVEEKCEHKEIEQRAAKFCVACKEYIPGT